MQEPIPSEDVARRVERRERRTDEPPMAATTSVFLPGREPTLEVTGTTVVDTAREPADGSRTYRLDLEIARRSIGVHAYPPGMTGIALERGRRLYVEQDAPQHLEGHLPDHLDLDPRPARLAKDLRVARRVGVAGRRPRREATTVFAPDDRYLFNDTSFPWCTCGRVQTPGGTASGVMVGPRHLLTVSHTIAWINPPNPNVADWVKFTPSYFDGSEPFGSAWATHTYWQHQVVGPGVDEIEAQYDYAVCVLDRPIGQLTGWVGTRSYSDDWDGGTYWSHVGYPGDLAGSERPSYQGAVALDGDPDVTDDHEAMFHQADVWPGQSGGPFLGWWEGEPWPRAVAVQSWQSSGQNGASGGASLVDLVIRARDQHP